MRRRDLIRGIGGLAASWPFGAFAQSDRMRRVGVLVATSVDDLEFQAWIASFLQALGQSGWLVGRNVRVDIRWAGAERESIRKHAVELAALAPDAILAHGTSTVRPLLQATSTVPIVFPVVADPVGAGFVDTVARPGRNATGFMTVEYSFSGKWLELLKHIAPRVKRVGVLRDASQGGGTSQFAVIQALAPSLGLDVVPIGVREADEIERDITAFAGAADGGLIVTAAGGTAVQRNVIIKLAARHNLPAVYQGRHFVTAGGLISYDADYIDQYQRAAGYIDRILRGEKPGDLPVQSPNKFELVINLKTATALGLTVPQSLLARANEVIE